MVVQTGEDSFLDIGYPPQDESIASQAQQSHSSLKGVRALIPLAGLAMQYRPIVHRVTPSLVSAQGGANVTLHGVNFGHVDAGAKVYISGRSCVRTEWVSNTEMVCIGVPAVKPGRFLTKVGGAILRPGQSEPDLFHAMIQYTAQGVYTRDAPNTLYKDICGECTSQCACPREFWTWESSPALVEDGLARNVFNDTVVDMLEDTADRLGIPLTYTCAFVSGNANLTANISCRPDGSMALTLAKDQNGEAVWKVTGSAGASMTATGYFSIVALQINSAPVMTAPNIIYLCKDQPEQTIPNAVQFAPGPTSDESWQQVEVDGVYGDVMDGNFNAIFGGNFGNPSLDADGTLRLSMLAPAEFVGSTTLTVKFHDNGGVGSGAVDTPMSCDVATNDTTLTSCAADRSEAFFTVEVVSANLAPAFQFLARTEPSFKIQVVTDGTDAGIVSVMESDAKYDIPSALVSISAGGDDANALALNLTWLSGDMSILREMPKVFLNGTLQFSTVAKRFGSVHFVVTLRDDGGTLCGGVDTYSRLLIINVVMINEPPSFALQPTMRSLTFTQGQCVYPGKCQRLDFAANISKGEFEQAQTIAFFTEIVQDESQIAADGGNAGNGSLMAVPPKISPFGTLELSFTKDAIGYAMVKVWAVDSGGGNNTSTAQYFTINVTSNDQPPQIVFNEQHAMTFANIPTVFISDDQLLEGKLMTFAKFVKIAPGPCIGVDLAQNVTFTYTVTSRQNFFEYPDGPQLVGGNVTCSKAPGNGLDWDLQFRIMAGSVDFTDVTITAKDNGGKFPAVVKRFRVQIVPRNQPPIFSPLASPFNVTLHEDQVSGRQVQLFATNIGPGGTGEEDIQMVSFIVADASPSARSMFLFGPEVQCSPDAAIGPAPDLWPCRVAFLVYELHPGAFGNATFNVMLADSGGTACEQGSDKCGVNASMPVELTFNVTEIDIAPTFTLRYSTLDVTTNSWCYQATWPSACRMGPSSLLRYRHRRVNFAMGVQAGDPLEVADASFCIPGLPCRVQNLSFTVTPQNTSAALNLFAQQPSFTTDGTLQFALKNFTIGEVTFLVRLTDSGQLSKEHNLTIRVHPRNFPPTFYLSKFQIKVPPFSAGGFEQPNLIMGVSVGPAGSGEDKTQNYTVSFMCSDSGANRRIAAGPVYRAEDNAIVFVPTRIAPTTTTKVTCTVRVTDDGGSVRVPVPEPEVFEDPRPSGLPDNQAEDRDLDIVFMGQTARAPQLGSSWISLSSETGFTSRIGHAMVEYAGTTREQFGKVYVIGGAKVSQPDANVSAWVPSARRLLQAGVDDALADVWLLDSSTCRPLDDLSVCTIAEQVTQSAAFGPRHSHVAASFAGRMWVMGGVVSGKGVKDDVWSSTDGASWIKLSESAGFGGR